MSTSAAAPRLRPLQQLLPDCVHCPCPKFSRFGGCRNTKVMCTSLTSLSSLEPPTSASHTHTDSLVPSPMPSFSLLAVPYCKRRKAVPRPAFRCLQYCTASDEKQSHAGAQLFVACSTVQQATKSSPTPAPSFSLLAVLYSKRRKAVPRRRPAFRCLQYCTASDEKQSHAGAQLFVACSTKSWAWDWEEAINIIIIIIILMTIEARKAQ